MEKNKPLTTLYYQICFQTLPFEEALDESIKFAKLNVEIAISEIIWKHQHKDFMRKLNKLRHELINFENGRNN